MVWCYETPKAVLTELRPFLEIGQRGDNYYLAEDGSVVCLDVDTGVIRWKNTDIGARANSFALGEDAIYVNLKDYSYN